MSHERFTKILRLEEVGDQMTETYAALSFGEEEGLGTSGGRQLMGGE